MTAHLKELLWHKQLHQSGIILTRGAEYIHILQKYEPLHCINAMEASQQL